MGCSRGKSHPTAGWGEAAQTGTPRTWPPALSPRCFQVSICPHLRKSSVSRTQGCSCGCLGASSLAGFSPLVWASLNSSWSPGPPASLSPLPAFLRYSLEGDPSPVLEGSLSPAGVPAPAPAPASQSPAGRDGSACLTWQSVHHHHGPEWAEGESGDSPASQMGKQT